MQLYYVHYFFKIITKSEAISPSHCLKIEERKRERYNSENVFDKEDKVREEEEEEQEEMLEELALTEIGSMGFFRRIIERIKRLIGK